MDLGRRRRGHDLGVTDAAGAAAFVRRNPIAPLFPVAFCYLLWLTTSTGQWFFADEWEFITTRSRPGIRHVGQFADVLFRPHNEHWSTLPIIVYRAVFGLVGLKAYWPYLVVLLALHCAVGVLLARRLRLHGVAGVMALLVVAMFLVYGAGSENILWAFQMAWMGSLCFGLAMLEVVGGPGRLRLPLAWALGVGALACSGVGISMVAVSTMAVLLRRSWRDALRVASVPALAQAVWYATYGRASSEASPIDWSSVPYQLGNYAWRAVTSTVERTTGLPGVGALAVIVLIAAAARADRSFAQRHAEALALAAGCVVFLGFVGIGRVGYDYPQASRYSYVIFVFLAPLAAVLTSQLLRRSGPGASWVALGLAVLSLGYSFGTLSDDAESEGRREQRIKRSITAAFVVARSGFAAPKAIPDPFSGDLTIDGVRQLLRQGISPTGAVSAQALADVTARTSVDMTPQPRVPLAGDSVVIASLGRMTAEAIESGCVGFFPTGASPQVSLVPRRATSIKLVPLVGGKVRVTVKRNGRASQPIDFNVVANNPVFVNLTDPRNEYILELPAEGESKACGLGQTLPR